MSLVALDARDAFVPMPHGSGVYVDHLLAALTALDPSNLTLWPLTRQPRGPEVVWEQVGLPARLWWRRAALLHGPDSFLPLRRPCPGVLTVHDLAFLALPEDMPGLTGQKYRALVPRCARSAERVICPSEFTAADLEQRCRVPRERIRVIPEAPALPRGNAPPPPGPYLLAAGDLRPKKNLETLVRAFARLHRAGVPHRLLIAGADFGKASSLRRLGAAVPVDLLGFVTNERLDALLRGADALVLPSLYEGFGLIAVEGMARGCPVLVARAGSLPEVGGAAAIGFEPFDDVALAGLLERLLQDPAERSRRADAGRARAAEFSWEATARATLDVYRELL